MKKIFRCDTTDEVMTIETKYVRADDYNKIHNMTIEEVENFIMFVNESTFRNAMRNIAKDKEKRRKIISFAQTIHGRLYDIIKEKIY